MPRKEFTLQNQNHYFLIRVFGARTICNIGTKSINKSLGFLAQKKLKGQLGEIDFW